MSLNSAWPQSRRVSDRVAGAAAASLAAAACGEWPWLQAASSNAAHPTIRFIASLLFDVMRRRLLPNFVRAHARRQLDQLEGAVVVRPLENGEVGDDHVDDVLASQRQCA